MGGYTRSTELNMLLGITMGRQLQMATSEVFLSTSALTCAVRALSLKRLSVLHARLAQERRHPPLSASDDSMKPPNL